MPKSILTEENKDFIRENYLLLSNQDMADMFGCSETPIQSFKNKSGLIVPKEVSRGFAIKKQTGKTIATAEQDDFIKEHFLSVNVNQLSIKLGVSESLVKNRLKHLGLIIPPEIIAQRIIDSRIQKGSIPPNKGKKQIDYMSEEAIERTKASRFQKGQIPKNAYNEVGKITIRHCDQKRGSRPYQYICLALGKWKELHVYNWEKINGKVPKGHCLWFSDGNSLNADISNLELITRKENYKRNTGWYKLNDKYIATTLSIRDKELREELKKHPDLLEIKRNQILLNRAINEKI